MTSLIIQFTLYAKHQSTMRRSLFQGFYLFLSLTSLCDVFIVTFAQGMLLRFVFIFKETAT